ncbi:hypothetical protein FNF31_00605 [Cafeteria roenbergensis]|uniref:PHD-type domain-containing protein n=1 Tax=Cafeteria roenbergensis TaxID=33653 RepID=A0A5A8DRP2_CAFRO|nr:hypothetical protein FNF31_00605 [Cafeteria roenbergensis]
MARFAAEPKPKPHPAPILERLWAPLREPAAGSGGDSTPTTSSQSSRRAQNGGNPFAELVASVTRDPVASRMQYIWAAEDPALRVLPAPSAEEPDIAGLIGSPTESGRCGSGPAGSGSIGGNAAEADADLACSIAPPGLLDAARVVREALSVDAGPVEDTLGDWALDVRARPASSARGASGASALRTVAESEAGERSSDDDEAAGAARALDEAVAAEGAGEDSDDSAFGPRRRRSRGRKAGKRSQKHTAARRGRRKSAGQDSVLEPPTPLGSVAASETRDRRRSRGASRRQSSVGAADSEAGSFLDRLDADDAATEAAQLEGAAEEPEDEGAEEQRRFWQRIVEPHMRPVTKAAMQPLLWIQGRALACGEPIAPPPRQAVPPSLPAAACGPPLREASGQAELRQSATSAASVPWPGNSTAGSRKALPFWMTGTGNRFTRAWEPEEALGSAAMLEAAGVGAPVLSDVCRMGGEPARRGQPSVALAAAGSPWSASRSAPATGGRASHSGSSAEASAAPHARGVGAAAADDARTGAPLPASGAAGLGAALEAKRRRLFQASPDEAGSSRGEHESRGLSASATAACAAPFGFVTDGDWAEEDDADNWWCTRDVRSQADDGSCLPLALKAAFVAETEATPAGGGDGALLRRPSTPPPESPRGLTGRSARLQQAMERFASRAEFGQAGDAPEGTRPAHAGDVDSLAAHCGAARRLPLAYADPAAVKAGSAGPAPGSLRVLIQRRGRKALVDVDEATGAALAWQPLDGEQDVAVAVTGCVAGRPPNGDPPLEDGEPPEGAMATDMHHPSLGGELPWLARAGELCQDEQSVRLELAAAQARLRERERQTESLVSGLLAKVEASKEWVYAADSTSWPVADDWTASDGALPERASDVSLMARRAAEAAAAPGSLAVAATCGCGVVEEAPRDEDGFRRSTIRDRAWEALVEAEYARGEAGRRIRSALRRGLRDRALGFHKPKHKPLPPSWVVPTAGRHKPGSGNEPPAPPMPDSAKGLLAMAVAGGPLPALPRDSKATPSRGVAGKRPPHALSNGAAPPVGHSACRGDAPAADALACDGKEDDAESAASAEDEGLCGVCFDALSDEADPIAYCDRCNIAVHARCYGVTAEELASSEWLCQPCRSMRRLEEAAGGTSFSPYLSGPVRTALARAEIQAACGLCGVRGGALIRSAASGHAWVHVLCVVLTPGTWIGDAHRMRGVALSPASAREASLASVASDAQLRALLRLGKGQSGPASLGRLLGAVAAAERAELEGKADALSKKILAALREPAPGLASLKMSAGGKAAVRVVAKPEGGEVLEMGPSAADEVDSEDDYLRNRMLGQGSAAAGGADGQASPAGPGRLKLLHDAPVARAASAPERASGGSVPVAMPPPSRTPATLTVARGAPDRDADLLLRQTGAWAVGATRIRFTLSAGSSATQGASAARLGDMLRSATRERRRGLLLPPFAASSRPRPESLGSGRLEGGAAAPLPTGVQASAVFRPPKASSLRGDDDEDGDAAPTEPACQPWPVEAETHCEASSRAWLSSAPAVPAYADPPPKFPPMGYRLRPVSELASEAAPCAVCGRTSGSRVASRVERSRLAVHPMCAWLAGWYVRALPGKAAREALAGTLAAAECAQLQASAGPGSVPAPEQSRSGGLTISAPGGLSREALVQVAPQACWVSGAVADPRARAIASFPAAEQPESESGASLQTFVFGAGGVSVDVVIAAAHGEVPPVVARRPARRGDVASGGRSARFQRALRLRHRHLSRALSRFNAEAECARYTALATPDAKDPRRNRGKRGRDSPSPRTAPGASPGSATTGGSAWIGLFSADSRRRFRLPNQAQLRWAGRRSPELVALATVRHRLGLASSLLNALTRREALKREALVADAAVFFGQRLDAGDASAVGEIRGQPAA